MNASALLPAFLLFVLSASPGAGAERNRLFIESSIGKNLQTTSGEVDNFYRTAFTFTGDLGYMLTRNIGIVPFSVTRRSFDFDSNKAEKHMSDRWLYYKWSIPEPYDLSKFSGSPADTEFQARSSREEISFTPGLIFFKPVRKSANVFFQAGGGFYRSRLTMEGRASEYLRYPGDFKDHSYSFSESFKQWGLLFSGGFEYILPGKATVTVKGRYNLIFRDNKSFDTDFEGSDIIKVVHFKPRELIGYIKRNVLGVNLGIRFFFL